MAARATAYLGSEHELLLTDLVAAETVYVLESFYDAPHHKVAEAVRSLIAFESVVCVDPALVLRAAEVHETARIYFADAYLVADSARLPPASATHGPASVPLASLMTDR